MIDIRNKKAISTNCTNLLMIGDFNYPEINWNEETCTRNDSHHASIFLEFWADNYLKQLVRQPTRYRARHEPSILDLVLTTNPDLISKVIHKPGIGKSDHEVLLIHIDRIFSKVKSPQTVEKKNYAKGN